MAIDTIKSAMSNDEVRALIGARNMARFELASSMRAEREGGIAEGVKQGIEQGKTDTARNMLALGFSVDVISQVTGIDLGKLTDIQEKMP